MRNHHWIDNFQEPVSDFIMIRRAFRFQRQNTLKNFLSLKGLYVKVFEIVITFATASAEIRFALDCSFCPTLTKTELKFAGVGYLSIRTFGSW